ncbi:MAG TPA: hypothetical protein VFS21_11460 [Roseiflexaceae bacterium]|nr:hypothetical protein [Roseiflexaceae bacterium]
MSAYIDVSGGSLARGRFTAQRDKQPQLISRVAGPVPAREEQLLAALPLSIAELRG